MKERTILKYEQRQEKAPNERENNPQYETQI